MVGRETEPRQDGSVRVKWGTRAVRGVVGAARTEGPSMPAYYQREGIAFQYPENWELAPEEYESGWTVSVQSPGTAFLTLTLDESMPGAGTLADAALEAIRSEYKQIDVEPVSATVAGLPAVGHDVEFFAFDLTNSCFIRSFTTGRGTVLVIGQATDLEGRNFDVLRAICASVRVDDEE
jgi:hypothetical protein